jgi:hypothetical protein
MITTNKKENRNKMNSSGESRKGKKKWMKKEGKKKN